LTHFVWSGSMLIGSVGAGALVVVNSGLPFLIAAVLNVLAVVFAVALLRSGRRTGMAVIQQPKSCNKRGRP
jgi:hypothetical protein